jgi:hypothetical protein
MNPLAKQFLTGFFGSIALYLVITNATNGGELITSFTNGASKLGKTLQGR